MNHAIAEMAKSLLADCEDRDRADGTTGGLEWWEPSPEDLKRVAEEIEFEHGRFPTVFEWQVAGHPTAPEELTEREAPPTPEEKEGKPNDES